MGRKMTVARWVTLLMAGLLAVLAGALLLAGNYTGRAMRRQAVRFNENLLQVYMEKLDGSIAGISRFLSQYAASQEAISVLAGSEDETDRFMAAQDIMRQLQNAAFLYDNFNGIFVFSRSAVDDVFLCQVGRNTDQSQVEDIRSMAEAGEEAFRTDGWELMAADGKSYLVQAVRTGSTSCGAWIDVETLAMPMDKIELGDQGRALFSDAEGKPLPYEQSVLPDDGFRAGVQGSFNNGLNNGLNNGFNGVFTDSLNNGFNGVLTDSLNNGSGGVLKDSPNGSVISLEGGRYLKISQASQYLPVALTVLIPDEVFARDVRRIQLPLFAVFGGILLAFPILWYILRRCISRPVEQLSAAMQRVGKGCLDTRVSPQSGFTEFTVIGAEFNRMVQHIYRLQQDVYERQLREQKTRLQYLQVQIRPHFFLNALNILYSYALTGRMELVEKLTLCLSRHFRYMLSSSAEFVPLAEELEHIGNYIQIQQLRFPDSFLYTQEVEETLAEALIPPLAVQCFIENSIKYGMPEKGALEISVSAEPVLSGNQGLRITIRDNGRGYPPAVLQTLRERKALPGGPGEHIGIENVKRRLELTYGDCAELHLYNAPEGGAAAELLLPLKFREEEDDDGEKTRDSVGGRRESGPGGAADQNKLAGAGRRTGDDRL